MISLFLPGLEHLFVESAPDLTLFSQNNWQKAAEGLGSLLFCLRFIWRTLCIVLDNSGDNARES